MGIRRTSLAIGLSLVVAVMALSMLGSFREVGSVKAEGNAALVIDMDPTNGSGPCNPVDTARSVNAGDTYQIAVCLTSVGLPPAVFQFDLLYNDNLNQCVPVECPAQGCPDGNPDANAGATTWGTSLGTGWDCNVMNVAPPTCDRDPGSGAAHGDAFLACMSLQDITLPVGEGVSAPIAMVTFKSSASGTDTFSLDGASVADFSATALVDPDVGAGSIVGGVVSTEGIAAPTATTGPGESTPGASTTPGAGGSTPNADAGPAATATAAAIATAVAQGTPLAAINDAATATAAAAPTKAATAGKTATAGAKATATVKPATSGGESGGSSGTNVALIAGIAVLGVIVVGGMGWLAYRRLRATKP